MSQLEISSKAVDQLISIAGVSQLPKSILFRVRCQEDYNAHISQVSSNVLQRKKLEGQEEGLSRLCAAMSYYGGSSVLLAAFYELDLREESCLPIIGQEDIDRVLKTRKSFNGTDMVRQIYKNKGHPLARLFDNVWEAESKAPYLKEAPKEIEPFLMWHAHAFLEGQAIISAVYDWSSR